MEKVVAIIPARGGSKGIPNKNVIDFCGKPLIAWSIEQARAVREIASVWVSSDSEGILSVAKAFGAQGILRPSEISGDLATSESAWEHALSEIEKIEGPVDLVVAMQATSPLRESADLTRALTDFRRGNFDSLFSSGPLEDFFIWSRNAKGELESVNYDFRNRRRRQDIDEQYVENGSFYLFRPWVIRRFQNRLGGKIGVSKMEFWKTFEIDSLKSLEMCEVLMRHYLLNVPRKTRRQDESAISLS